MKRALVQWIIDYQFSHYYRSEIEWQKDFEKFCEALKKARIHLDNYSA